MIDTPAPTADALRAAYRLGLADAAKICDEVALELIPKGTSYLLVAKDCARKIREAENNPDDQKKPPVSPEMFIYYMTRVARENPEALHLFAQLLGYPACPKCDRNSRICGCL